MFVVGLILHYPQQILLAYLFPPLDFGGFAIERILFLLPISYAGFMFGVRAGFMGIAVAVAIMLPRVFLFSPNPTDALLETSSVVIVGGLVNLWFQGYRKERERTQQTLLKLETAQGELQSYIRVVRSNEKRLTAFKEVSDVVSQSLELQDVLNAAINKVMEVMKAEVAKVFMLNEESQELELEVYQGISEESAVEVNRLKVGEGFNGRVVQTGEPLVVEDASNDPRLTRSVVKREGLHAQIIMPLRAKGRVIGTLCIARRNHSRFSSEDLELLYPIASHIGVAADNARLYHKERIMAEQIAEDASVEKTMRENLSFYLRRVTRAQEGERTRIARELHDETAQDLIALSRQVEDLIPRVSHLSPKDASLLENLRDQIDRTLSGVRRFSQDLRPSILDDLGLLPALEWLTSDISHHFGINIEIQVAGSAHRFAPEVELVLFRIVQEALRNVCKHSGASKAEVRLEFGEENTVVSVKDNGKGFEVQERTRDLDSSGKLGLVGMQERARLLSGSLNIESKMGKGTNIVVTVPLTQV
jgi:signal transduction histidine kinase